MVRRMFIIILALVLCALIWWIGPLVAIGSWLPLTASWIRLLLIIPILCLAFWPLLASALGWLVRQGRAPLSAAKNKPARDSVTHRFHDVLRTLQLVGQAKQRSGWQRLRYRLTRSYLNDRPWFMLVGPHNSGKTLLLSQSNQAFILAGQSGSQQIPDTGPTQDCDWWLTEQAVWIDTAGDWMQLNGLSEETARNQSRLFKLLRRHRKNPSLDGLFICLNCHVLLHAPMTERKALGDTLRMRLLEIAALARSDQPVCLMLTHLDQLAGGELFLTLLADKLLHNGIGFTGSQELATLDNLPAAQHSWQQMVSRVSHYILELLHDTPALQQRKQLLIFPETLGALAEPLFSLLKQVFPPVGHGYFARLQQVWLGSTRLLTTEDSLNGEGRPAATLYAPALQQAIDRRYTLQPGGRALPPGGQLAKYALVLVLLAGAVWMMSSRYVWEKDYIAWISARFDESRQRVNELPLGNRVSDDLIAAFEQLGYMNAQLQPFLSPTANPWFEHRLIAETTMHTWHRHLREFFWPAVENYVTAALQQSARSNNEDVYGTLKIYLMLAEPAHREGESLVSWFQARWHDYAPPGNDEINRRLFGYHLHELFTLQDLPAMKVNEHLVHQARVKAAEISLQQRVVRRIEQSTPSSLPDITLANAAGSDVTLTLRRKSAATVSDVGVGKFYTRASYRDIFLPQLHRMAESVIREEAWVMGQGESPGNLSTLTSAQRLADEARKLYLLEYANSWSRFLNDIRARPVNGLEDAAQLARQLGDSSSSLANLLRFATRETSLTGKDSAGETSWFDRQKTRLERQKRTVVDEITGERSRFRLTPEDALEDRFQPLRRLGLALSGVQNGGNDPLTRIFDELFNQLSALATSQHSGQMLPQNGLARSRLDAARQPEPVRSVIMDLILLGNSESLKQNRMSISKSASSLASGLCNSTVSQRYPFSRQARSEVGIDDFSRLFGQRGAMKTYFEQNMLGLIDVNSRPWKAREAGAIGAATVRSFENAEKIRETFFANGDSPSFTLYIRPLSLSSGIKQATLDIDGQQISYASGPHQPVRIDWPGPKGGSYIRLTFTTASGGTQTAMFEGPWALFRLYDASEVTRIDADRRQLEMAMAGVAGSLRLELRGTMKDFPLWSRALQNFSCP